MTAKKEAKKRKRAQRRKNKPKNKSPQARFYEKIKKSENLSPSIMVVEPEGQAKMSEVILEFAEPLLEQCKDEKSAVGATGLAILVWNLSLLPEKNQKQKIEKICSEFAGSDDPKDYDELMSYANLLLERKREHFSGNQRAIVSYQISGSGKNRRLDVASTLSL